MRKQIICDSSSLISLTEACLLDILYLFSEKYNVDFVIPPSVEEEIVERPLRIEMRAYRLSALRMKKAIKDGVLLKVNADTERDAEFLLKIANSMFFSRGRPIHLIDKGEAEMIALANFLDVNYLLMDERTTRMLIEAPFKLKEHLEEELSSVVMLNKKNYRLFTDYVKNMEVIRSVDLVAVGYSVGYFDGFEGRKEALSAALYKLKYSGCSVGFDEIERFLRSLG